MCATVVLVDDDPAVRSMLQLTLARKGYEVVASAGSPAAGLSAWRAHRPDVVVLDLEMTDHADGITLAERIFALDGEAQVLFFSGCTDPAILRRVRGSRARAVVTKGTRLDRLLEEVGAAAIAADRPQSGIVPDL